MVWLSLHLAESAVWMEYILTISLYRHFKNTTAVKSSHSVIDIAWNVTKYHEANDNIWQVDLFT
jgi:hypothetical protein